VFWYSVTKTGPRQQRIHEAISYIKTRKNSILQIHANTHIREFYCEHGMSDSRIILHIAIQAKKIDVDFQGGSLATNKGICGKHSITYDSYNFLQSSFCIVSWRWLLAILSRGIYCCQILGPWIWLIFFHIGSRLGDRSIGQR